MNTEDMDYYEYEENKKRFTPKKIFKFLFKLTAFIIIAGTFALILGRIALMNVPKSFTKITATPAILEAYNSGELSAELYTPSESFDDGVKVNGKLIKGRYHVSNVAISNSTNEVQVTFRYNSRSTINVLMELYGLSERPTDEVFVFTLSDDNGNIYNNYIFASKSNILYEFRRIIFENVDLTEVSNLYLNIYYRDDVSANGLMNHTFVIYEKDIGGEMFSSNQNLNPTKLTFHNAPDYISMLDS